MACQSSTLVSKLRYYRNTVLGNMLLPDIRHVSGEWYIFQQNSALAHSVCVTVELLERGTPEFIFLLRWPPISVDSNPTDNSVWSLLQDT